MQLIEIVLISIIFPAFDAKKIGVAGVIGFDGSVGRHPSAALQAILSLSISHPIIPIYYYFVAYFMIATAIQFFFLPNFSNPLVYFNGSRMFWQKKVPALLLLLPQKMLQIYQLAGCLYSIRKSFTGSL